MALVRHARGTAIAMLVASAVAGAGAGLLLKVRPGYVDLLDPSSPLQKRYLDLLAELGNVEALHVVVESEDPQRAAAFVDAFAAGMPGVVDEDGLPLAKSVIGRIDLAPLHDRLPAWLPATQVDALAASPGLMALAADPSPLRIVGAMHEGVLRAAASGEAGADAPPPAVLGSVLGGLDRIARGEDPPVASSLLAGAAASSALGLDETGHVALGPGRLLVTVMPADLHNDPAILEQLMNGARRVAAESALAAGGGVTASFTGAPALIVDEMRAVRRDVALGSALSFVLVTLLFFVSFNSLRHVVFAAMANACGLALTFGAAWILVGYLNLFSSVFAAVLAGLGIDFGIHFINFYEARRREGLAAEPALVDAFASVLPPIAVSAVTTAAAFFTVMTSEFAGFSQLGLISGVGVLLCLLTAFTLVPALLAWSARSRPGLALSSKAPWSMPLLMVPVRRWRMLAPAGVVVVAGATLAAASLGFDHDLMKLQPGGTEAVALQRDGARRVGTHPAFSLADGPAQARERADAFRKLPSVATVHSPADALPVEDAARPAALRKLVAALADVTPSAAPADDALALQAAAAELHATLVEMQDLAFEGGRAEDVAALDIPVSAAASLAEALQDPAAAPRMVALRADLTATLQRMTALLPVLAERGVTVDDLPEGLRTLVGRSGRLGIAVVPRESIWDRPALVRFLAEIRTVDPSVTGPAVQVAEVTELMRVSLQRAAILALVVIVVLVLLSTRSVLLAALSLLPLACGFVMMLGLMRGLGVPLNPANLVALPLLLGIGVDGGVHLVHRWHLTKDAARAVSEVGHALLITSLTTVAGFLPLTLARHAGIRSLGIATCLGSVAMLVSVVLFAPAFLAAIDAFRARRTA